MRVVVMGCGRVGASVADGLSRIGHEVAIIDRDSAAFNRLSPQFAGERVLESGLRPRCAAACGHPGADAFAAVSSGDNSNIISARLARETFGVPRVVARIYDAKRAEVYERLGIPTIATVPWTTDRLLNALMQDTETAKWRDPTSTVAVAEVVLHEDWVGHRATDLEQATGARIAFLIRFGTGVLPEPKTVLQAGDKVYIAAISGRAAEAAAIAALPPSEDFESGLDDESSCRRSGCGGPLGHPRTRGKRTRHHPDRAQPRPPRRRRHPGGALAAWRCLRTEPAGVDSPRRVRRGRRRHRGRQGQRGAQPASQDRIRGAAGGGPGQRSPQRVAVQRRLGVDVAVSTPACWRR